MIPKNIVYRLNGESGVTILNGQNARHQDELKRYFAADPEASEGKRESSTMNLLLLIPDGVGVRNFLLGDFLHRASEKGRVHVLHNISENLLATYNLGFSDKVQWQPLTTYQDRLVPYALRKALSYAQMHWADTQAMSYTRKLPLQGSWRRRTVTRAARLAGRAAASERGILMLDRWHVSTVNRSSEVEYYRRLLKEIKPSVIFCSHQRPLTVLPAVIAARSLKIPTATFIFSWDNLTSKGRIVAPFDYYLVWSDHMREELLRYYPEVSAEQIHVVGTPQFDPYADDRALWPREEFFKRVGADPSRPLICYSGGDVGNYPEEHQLVRVLMELIRAGRIHGNPQVLLRPAPVDEGSRYDAVRRDYPELIYAQPQWVHTEAGDWAGVIPLAADVQLLANLTRWADLNINLASTMTLDFAIHNKPVVNVAFDTTEPPPFGVPLWDYYYQFEHYRPVVELGAARFARSPEELAEHVNAYLENPDLDRVNRERLVELEVGSPIGRSSQRIIDVLMRIAC